ncbi:uncharacterized protein LOC107771288 isoform X2 [Nicotiana tabacum]|uniref:Uncharacterized protein LOC107771288 isoform X2 n=6 Tax=Nicotiana tabacum TaxID=4097 RepID=A0AC58RN38_TOBAC
MKRTDAQAAALLLIFTSGYCKCEMPYNPDEFMGYNLESQTTKLKEKAILSQSNNKQERYIYGMLAFALLELGRYTDAEEAANKGFEIDSEDAWTHHAVYTQLVACSASLFGRSFSDGKSKRRV